MQPHRIRARLQTLLDGLDYDFSRFTLDGFKDWLERRRGRPIVFVPRAMPATLFGAWVQGIDADYVFFEQDTPLIHQAHNQLHELAHMICGHPTVVVGPQQVGALLRHAGSITDPTLFVESLLLRSAHSDEHELEAETLTALIQERVLQHARLDALWQGISTERAVGDHFTAYLKGMAQL
jgi:hypothetical protein